MSGQIRSIYDDPVTKYYAKKGQVREAIVKVLAQEPHTVSELARILGVSKPTINYHINELSKRAAITVAQVRVGRTGVLSKYYALKPGTLFVSSNPETDDKYLLLLSGFFERRKLQLSLSENEPLGPQLKEILSHAFKLLTKVSYNRHSEILYKHGFGVGHDIVSKRIQGGSVKETLGYLKKFWIDNQMGELQVSAERGYKPAVYLHNCLDSFETRDTGGALCFLIKGIIDGVLASTFGSRYETGKYEFNEADVLPCRFQILKRKH